ncbi:MAG: hypothetical protein ACOX5G_04500 [Kiritimatiellia bacterium]|jgi:hypothetical protein
MQPYVPPLPPAAFAEIRSVAQPTGATGNRAPAWTDGGTFVYRVCTPDEECLQPMREGIRITANLLDNEINHIAIINGVIGHDHPGGWNWDGLWPYWNRVTFRAGSWEKLAAFMSDILRESNAKASFHVNLTDVNAGLRDYPETRAFFERLVETRSIYRRDFNSDTRKRDIGPPYVMKELPANANPVEIVSLVNYGNFWDSGLAKEMLDEFFARMPYAPPVLYVDVLTLQGSNFETGYPDGPLGGSRDTQLQGVLHIAGYLRSRGTEIGTEGDRPELGDYGTYGWLHCDAGAGLSTPDYAKIKGAAKGARAVLQQVYGNTGAFAVSPVANSAGQIAKVRDHHATLLAGRPSRRPMPGIRTWHIADRSAERNEFDMLPGDGGDPFRGDWTDLVNNFYMVSIQELFHIGNRSVRTAGYRRIGVIHIAGMALLDAGGNEAAVRAISDADLSRVAPWAVEDVKRNNRLMLEEPVGWTLDVPAEGDYRFCLDGYRIRDAGAINVYVNGRHRLTSLSVQFGGDGVSPARSGFGTIRLQAGTNEIRIDCGPVYAAWSDGTEALWLTPSLGTGFTARNGDVVYAVDYDRMWPDTWSGARKIHFFSWDGTSREWLLPEDWADAGSATLYPLTPDGRGAGEPVAIRSRRVSPELLPQVPYVLVRAE